LKYKIRRRTRNDVAKIESVITSTWQSTYRGIINDAFLDNLSDNENIRVQKMLNRFGDGTDFFLVLEVDGEIVGFANIGVTEDKRYRNCGEIYALYILDKYHHLGLGKKLVEVSFNELKKFNCRKAIIGCIEQNPSNKFYEHIGGELIRKRHFKIAGQDMLENVYIFIF
jgi:GNAT superfamily N-acetyltransferase